LFTTPGGLELTQADLFVHYHKYDQAGSETDVMRRRALTRDLLALMERFLGKERSEFLLDEYEKKRNLQIRKSRVAGEELIHFVEVQLSGSLGAASAKVLVRSIAREDPIGMEEMLKVLDQTQEAVQYSKALEEKSRQLEKTTHELKEANEKLLELDRLKAGFIRTVTHELRTPITAIRGMAGILRDFQDLETEKKEEFLIIIHKESERLSRLVNQVLDVEKIPRESADSFHPLDLSKLVAEAAHSLDALIREKSIECTFALDPNASTLGNGDRLTQVVVNLLSNAIKFCPDKRGKIDICLSRQGRNHILSIRDNGIGIPEGQQDRIFEQFTQLDSPTRGKPGGSGLGLYISRQIIETHGGSIRVTSREGEGACFLVSLPAHRSEPEPQPQKGNQAE
jgi:signal transduction histidine kinase